MILYWFSIFLQSGETLCLQRRARWINSQYYEIWLTKIRLLVRKYSTNFKLEIGNKKKMYRIVACVFIKKKD